MYIGILDVYINKKWRLMKFSLPRHVFPLDILHSWHPFPSSKSLRSKNLRSLNSHEVRYVISKALEVWSTHSKLTFTEVDSDRADILVYFYRGDHGDNFPFDGKGQVLAHAFFPATGRGGDAHFDEDELWLTREFDDSEDGTSLFHVAAHEFGHSLGLSHSPVEGALMYPWYQGKENGFNYSLPEDDRLGIQNLYGANQDRLWGIMPAYNPAPTTPRTTTTTPYTPRTHYPRTRRPYYVPNVPRYPHDKPYRPHKPHYPKYPNKDRKHSTRKYPINYPTRTTSAARETPTTTTSTYPRKEYPYDGGPPDTCDTSYDAISVIRREVFIFKDEYFWRIGDGGLKHNEYPAKITRLWHELPDNLTHVDAVYERSDGRIVFFIGKHIYVFLSNRLETGYPKLLTELGLPSHLEKIDGALVWGHNGKTYFYSNDVYWVFDEDTGKVEYDYPRHMSMWAGVQTPIDAVFQWKDGKTYFFKGKKFWKFNDLRMRVENEDPLLSAPFWMGCTKNLIGGEVTKNKLPYIQAQHSTGITKHFSWLLTCFAAILCLGFL